MLEDLQKHPSDYAGLLVAVIFVIAISFLVIYGLLKTPTREEEEEEEEEEENEQKSRSGLNRNKHSRAKRKARRRAKHHKR